MTQDTLTAPLLTHFTALSLGRAVLTIEDGQTMTVGARHDQASMSSSPPFVLHLSRTHAVYQIPAPLRASLQAALGLAVGTPPLLLTGMEKTDTHLTLSALDGEGEAVCLTLPRPVWIEWTAYEPGDRAQCAAVSFEVASECPAPGFRVNVDFSTAQGDALLKKLWQSRQASLPDLPASSPQHFQGAVTFLSAAAEGELVRLSWLSFQGEAQSLTASPDALRVTEGGVLTWASEDGLASLTGVASPELRRQLEDALTLARLARSRRGEA